MFSHKNASFLRCISECHHLNALYATQAAKHLSAKEVTKKQLSAEIQPPKAKKWSKTAVLEALQESVKFSVRPDYMAPPSPQYWGSYDETSLKWMSRMNGIKAANYVISKQKRIFEHDWDADDIDPWLAMNPDEQFLNDPFQEEGINKSLGAGNDRDEEEVADNEENDLIELKDEDSNRDKKIQLNDSLESLQVLMSMKKPENAAKMFLSLKESEVDIPDAVVNQLIGFLAFYRASSNDVEVLQKNPEQSLYSWRSEQKYDLSLLNKVFESIQSPTPEQQMACIRSFVLNFDRESAINAYTDFNRSNHQADLEALNSMMAASLLASPTFSNCVTWLEKIRDAGYVPNQQSFINLFMVRPSNTPEAMVHYWSKVMNEMKTVGLDVGLYVYSAMIYSADLMLHHAKKIQLQVKLCILEHMRGRKFDPDDPLNVAALDALQQKLVGHPECMKLFWEIITSGENYKLLEKSPKQFNLCYRRLVSSLKSDNMEEVWATLQQLVPVRFGMNERTTSLLIQAIYRNKRPEYLPITYALYLDRVNKFATARGAWIDVALRLADVADEDTCTQLAVIGTDLHFRLGETRSRIQQLHLLNSSLQLVAKLGTVSQTAELIKTYLEKYSALHIHEETRQACRNLLDKFPQSTILQKAVDSLEKKWKGVQKTQTSGQKSASEGRSRDPYADDWWP